MIEEDIYIVQDKSQPPDLRLDAILSIVDNFGPEHFPIFEEILNDASEHPDVRSAIALALGKIGGDRAQNALTRHIDSDDITVRNYVIQGLGRLGSGEVAPLLVNALKDKSNIIFASAAEALGKLGKPAVPHLIALLDQGADDARCVAAWQLGELRYTDAVPALVKVVREQTNPEVVALSIWALGEIGFGPQEVLETLDWAKAHENPDIHRRAQLAMKKIARHTN